MSDPLTPEEEEEEFLSNLRRYFIPSEAWQDTPESLWAYVEHDVRALAARAVPAGLDVERLAEAVFRVGTGHRNRDLALIHPRIANSQDGAKASREFAEAVAREYDHLRRRQGERP